MNKKEFIEQLKSALLKKKIKDQESIIDYYEELISDAIDDGKNEIDFIANLGTIEEIIKKENMEEKIKNVENGPGVHNSLKATFAILGVISSPIWIPIAFTLLLIVLVIFLVGIVLVFSFGIATIALLISLIASFFAIFLQTPFALFLLLPLIGLICIFTGLTMIMAKLTFQTLPGGMVKLLKRIYQKGEEKNV